MQILIYILNYTEIVRNGLIFSPGLQQHLLHDGVSEPSALPVPILAEDVPRYIQLGARMPGSKRRLRLYGQAHAHY